ncbi:hypothetical protein ACIRN4_08115 [Pimelobacter simplex]|uniref:hypothetical protein n=1 Tax=Nocardioides simplex TaxID=2045 RepID=UPI0037FC68F7
MFRTPQVAPRAATTTLSATLAVTAALALAVAAPLPGVTPAAEAAPAAPAAPATPAAAAAPAASAADGSIVYVHDANVWLTRPDGSGRRQVTRDGTAASPYTHPSMSDSGVIAVMRGETIVRMSQDGVVLNRITPEDLFIPDSGTVTISPIQGAEISPDGTKIAYSQLRLERYGGPGGYLETETETSFTDAGQWSTPDKYGIVLGYQPGWASNSRVTLYKNGDVHLADLGQAARPWFRSGDLFDSYVELLEPEISRDGKRVLFGMNGGGVAMKTTVGDPRSGSPTPAKPTANPECYLTPDPGQPVATDATFGPDSDSAVYTEGGDLWVVRGLAACSAQGTTLTRIATGGTEPDWSPAPLSAPPAPPGEQHAFALAKAPAVSGRAKVGKRLRASAGTWSPAPSGVTYAWLRNGRVVPGRTTATYAVTRADRGKRIQVRVTVRRPGYTTRTALSRAVVVRR